MEPQFPNRHSDTNGPRYQLGRNTFEMVFTQHAVRNNRSEIVYFISDCSRDAKCSEFLYKFRNRLFFCIYEITIDSYY